MENNILYKNKSIKIENFGIIIFFEIFVYIVVLIYLGCRMDVLFCSIDLFCSINVLFHSINVLFHSIDGLSRSIGVQNITGIELKQCTCKLQQSTSIL